MSADTSADPFEGTLMGDCVTYELVVRAKLGPKIAERAFPLRGAYSVSTGQTVRRAQGEAVRGIVAASIGQSALASALAPGALSTAIFELTKELAP